jgi:hypothetical protein
MVVALLVAAIVVALGIGVVWSIFSSRARRSPFRERAEMTSDEIYSAFYADSSIEKDEVSRSLREIADKLQVPVGKLRPSDSFMGELAPNPGWEYDDGLGMLSDLARNKLTLKGDNPENVTQIRTVDDYIRLTSQTRA